MTEVHRYKVVTMLSAAGATIGYDPHGPDVVMASAFDEATRLFLDAAERCVAAERREKELQQRLTEADERVDLLEKDASRWNFFSSIANQLQAFPHSWGLMTPEKMNHLCDEAMTAALNAAEPTKCERCGCSTVETCDERGCGYLGAGNGAPE